MNSIGAFVKYNREKLGITQEQLSSRAGLGIHFIRDLEQGKPSVRLDKVDKVLALFGHRLGPVADKVDPYQLWQDYKNEAVEITLKDRSIVRGFLVKELRDERNSIVAWTLVPFPNILGWMQKEEEKFAIRITHREIDSIQKVEQ